VKPIEAAKLVAMLSAAYRDAPISEATAEVYEAMLADLPFAATQAAVARLVATSKWFPTVAEIREAVVAVERGAVRSGVEAWGDVVTECVELTGWRGLCLGENEAADRAKFVQLYDALAARDRTDAQAGRALPAPTRGLLEAPRGGPPSLAFGGNKT
jgi:hypothetical protein